MLFKWFAISNMEIVPQVLHLLRHGLLYAVFSLLLYILFKRKELYRFTWSFPSYWGLPLIGMLPRIKRPENVIKACGEILEECQKNAVVVWLGFDAVLLDMEPDHIEKILQLPELLNKAKSFYDPLYRFLGGGGLVALKAEPWHNQRKLLVPSFNHKVLQSFFPIFHKTKRHMIAKFDDMVGKGEFQLGDFFDRLLLGLTVETTMGKTMQEGDEVDEALSQKCYHALANVINQMVAATMRLDFIFSSLPSYKQSVQYMKDYVYVLITEKLKNLEKVSALQTSADAQATDDLHIKKKPNIFLDQLIQLHLQQKIDFENVMIESYQIILAAFESTAHTINSAIAYLAMNPLVQQKLFEEVVQNFPEKDFEMLYEHQEDLPYLEMVIMETLRLSSALPMIGRHVIKPTKIAEGLILPRDMQILIPIFHLHRRKDIWGPEADKFNPDNFLPDLVKERHPYAFLPFSKGPRNCIGWRYALMSLRVTLSGLVRNFRFTTSFKYEDLEYISHVSTKFLVEPGIEIHRRDT